MKRLISDIRNIYLRYEKRLTNYLTAKRLLYLGFCCVIIFPWLFTREFSLIHFNADTGVIGDTIGGITGPVSGFLGAALVYLALKEQIKANTIITDQFKEQKKEDRSNRVNTIVMEQLKMLREDIKDFEYDYSDFIFTSKEAINKLMSRFPERHINNPDAILKFNSKINEIKYFLSNIDYLLKLSKHADIHEEDKVNLMKMVFEVYNTKLSTPLFEFEYKRVSRQPPCTCGQTHGIPESFYEINDSIIQILTLYKLIN